MLNSRGGSSNDARSDSEGSAIGITPARATTIPAIRAAYARPDALAAAFSFVFRVDCMFPRFDVAYAMRHVVVSIANALSLIALRH